MKKLLLMAALALPMTSTAGNSKPPCNQNLADERLKTVYVAVETEAHYIGHHLMSRMYQRAIREYLQCKSKLQVKKGDK